MNDQPDEIDAYLAAKNTENLVSPGIVSGDTKDSTLPGS